MDAKLAQEIDHLYQLPLEAFVPARNELARRLSGKEAALVKDLRKPAATAWAVNQLYWRERDAIAKIEKTADDLRRKMKHAAPGGSADVRTASAAHREAVQKAHRRTLAILRESGHRTSPETSQSILHTLDALPGDEPLGRLTRPLEPKGFDVFAGLNLPARKAAPPPRGRQGSEEEGEKKKNKAEKEERETARLAATSRKAHREDQERRKTERREIQRQLKKEEVDLARSRKEATAARALSKRAEADLQRALSEERRARQALERAQEKRALKEKAAMKAREDLDRSSTSLQKTEETAVEMRERLGRRRS